MMKKLLIALACIVVLAVAAVIVGPALVDLRPRIAALVRDRTGRTFRIDGPLRIRLLPRVVVSAEGVHLANAPGASRPEMLSIDSVVLQAEPWSLLPGHLAVDTVSITGLTANFEIDENGRPNWAFGSAAGLPPAANGTAPISGGGTQFRGMAFGNVSLDRGALNYRDATTGRTIDARDISLTASMGKPDSPLSIRGRMTLNNEPVTLTASASTPAGDGQISAVRFGLDSKHINVAFDGSVRQRPPFGLDGIFDLTVPSVGRLATWLREPLGASRGDPGPLKAHAMFASDGAKVALKDASIVGTAVRATAHGDFDGGQAPPVFDAHVDVSQADLNAYLPPPSAKSARAESGTASGAGGWSTEPFNLALLGRANGRAEVTVGSARYRDMEISNGDVLVTLRDRILRLANGKLTVASGSVVGSATLDGSAGGASVDSHIVIAGLRARPVLMAFAETDRIDGKLDFESAIKGKGANEAALIASLDGSGRFRMTDGSIRGINLAQTLRKAGTLGLSQTETDRTDFSELSGDFTIRSGVIDNRDLRLTAPVVRATGGGTIPLPPRTVDYTVEAKLAPALVGQGQVDSLAGLPIPIRITGPWSNLSYSADWAGVFRQISADPERLRSLPSDLGSAAKEAGVTLPAPVGNILNEIPGVAKPSPGAPVVTPSPLDVLRRFGGH